MPIWHIPTFRSFFLLEALLPVGLSLRPLHEDVSVEAEGLRTEVCGGIRCFTFSYSGRINQGHFVMKPEDTQKLAWKLKAGSKYALHSSQDCLENHLLASASVVPWIDRDNPTQASTIEVFVDPKKIWNLSQSQDVANHAFLCASEMHHSLKSTCLCSLRLRGKRDRFLARLAGPSLMKVSGIADVQLAAERRCDSLLLPEVAALVLLALALCNVLVSGEALVARHRFITQTHHPNDNVRQELVLQSSPNAKLYHGTSLAVGFTTLTITMQTLAARIIVQVGAAEPLVHSMIWAALAFGVCGIWLFYTTLCRNQLVQSCLGLKICICNVPSTKRITSLMVGTVFGYVLVISGCLLRSVDSLPEAIKVVAAVVSSVVGPTMGILKAFRNSLEAEQADVQVKMQVDDFKDVIQAAGGRAAEASNKSPNHRFGGWSFVPWSAVVSSCRRGSFPDNSLEIDGGATSPDEGQEMNLLFDVAWHRVVVRKLTGSFAGFFVVPSCTLALSLIVATTVLQAVVYSCSRGELQMLEILGGSLEVDFVKWQDRFTVQSDASYRQAFLVATADSYGRSLDFEPPEEHHAREQDSGSQRLISKVNLIRLQEMKIPRVANISVQGLRQSQAGMTYSVQFATARKLPVFLQISHPRSGFRRCFPWGALVDSEMSMPPLANSGLKVSVVLADYVVGPPYTRQTTDQMEAAGLDATWTTFETFQSMHCEPSDLQCCKQLCIADPNCLETLLGEGGCYFTSHNHSLQSDLCEKALNTTGHRKKTGQAAEEAFHVTLHGCIGKRGNGGASSLCGSVGLDEGERMVDFGEISPDWKGGLRASLGFEMTPSTGSLQVPVERQTIELRRDMPMVMDVLVYLGGRPRKSPEEFVPLTTRGSVTDDGNIKVHVSKYEPLDFSALELVLVPILPDRRFRVHWASLPGDAADAGQGVLPRFARCEESLLLQQRYKACGGPGAWDSQPVSLNVSRWFTGFMPKFFVAPADDAEASAGRWISKPELQDVSIDFNGSDKPVAWLAKTLGCNLFDIEPMEYKEVAVALPKSADAQCELLAKGCMKSHKSLMCSNILASLKPEGWLGQGIDSSDLLQLLGCFKNASMGKKVCSDPDVDVPWFGPFQWRPEEKNFEIVFRNYVKDSYLRHGVEISEKELFSSIARIAVQHAEINFWTGFLAEVREICLSDVHRGRSAYQHQHALSWLLNSLRTGSLDFIRHIIKECLEDVSTQLKHEDFRAASAAAWQGIRLQEPVAHFNASALLIGVAEILGGHMTEGLVEAAVISGHNIEEPEAMDTFLEARKTDVLKLNFGLDTASAVTDLGPILKKTSELRELHVECWRCGPGQDMPVGVLEDNGFFLSLGKLSKLRLLEMPAFSMPAPVVQGFVAAVQGIKLDKLYLHGYDRPSFEPKFLKLFAPLCVHWLEVASFLFTSRDALEVVRAFNSSNEPSAWGCLTKLRFEELYRFPEESAALQNILRERHPEIRFSDHEMLQ